jgi:hypothetical protein
VGELPIEWIVAVPFALNALRASAPLALMTVPRDHAAREQILAAILLAALASDLVDGALARALGITGWESLYWTDHGADFLCVVGACVVLSRDASWAADVGGGGGRRAFVPWLVANAALAIVVAVLIAARALGRY